ncbi:MAG: DUF423 domain-containing protein [Myxococcota bacterium]|jgi:uncharacterized membrane protein YgdD (TMEM256/DUF423 family)|nr:DUF423 domain-containing protein [Myxococcota bacterium]
MIWIVTAGLSGALAVIAGAFGAHGLRDRVSPEQLSAWTTASQYHLLHSIVILALALYALNSQVSIRLQGGLFAAGVIFFSGSIYLLVLTEQRWLGPVTPIGGLLLMAAWGSLLLLARPSP